MEWTIVTKLFLVCSLILGLVGIAFMILSILSFFLGGVPFVTTPVTVMTEMMELADIRRGETVYDLGCGDGRLLIEANHEYGAKAIGIELSPFFYRLAKIKTLSCGNDVKVIRGNVFEFDFSDADVVFCYLMPKPMKKLESRFRNLKQGCRIISYRFEIPGWKPLVHIKRDYRSKTGPIFKYQV